MSFVGRDTEIAKKELAIRGRSGKRALTSGPLDYSPLLLSPHPSHPLSFSFSLHLSNCPTSSSLSSLSLFLSFSYLCAAVALFLSQKYQLRVAQTRRRKVLFSRYVDKNASRSCQNYVTTIFECCLTPTSRSSGE